MSGTASNVKVWAEIEVYTAPIGTTPPVSPSAAIAAPWVPWGFMSPDGVKQTLDESSDTLKSYEGIPVFSISSFDGSTFEFTAIEDNDVVDQYVYEGSAAPTTVTGVKTFIAKIPQRVPYAWLIHMHTGTDHALQIMKKGQISGVSLADKKAADLGGATITVSRLAGTDKELFTRLTTAAV